jgi:hypothetical protein
MRKGVKVLCFGSVPAWGKNASPYPRNGWVYVIEEVACFDADKKPAKLGNGEVVAFALQGIKSKVGNPREYYAADCFHIVGQHPVKRRLSR